jgi:hypothetical protein
MLQLKNLKWEKNTLIQRRYANGGSVRGVGLLAVLVFDNIPCREAAPIPALPRNLEEAVAPIPTEGTLSCEDAVLCGCARYDVQQGKSTITCTLQPCSLL